jgi:hypothetical protein
MIFFSVVGHCENKHENWCNKRPVSTIWAYPISILTFYDSIVSTTLE